MLGVRRLMIGPTFVGQKVFAVTIKMGVTMNNNEANTELADVRSEYYRRERVVNGFGVLTSIFAGFSLFTVVITSISVFFIEDQQYSSWLWLVPFVCIAFFLTYLARGLLNFDSKVRLPALVFSLLTVVLFPIGTVLGIYLFILNWIFNIH